MAEIYGAQTDAQAAQRCPGEANCRMFQSAAEPKDHACRGCKLLPTKPGKGVMLDGGIEADEDDIAALIDQVQTIAAEQRAGFQATAAALPPLVFELLVRWHAAVRSYENALRAVA